MRKWTQGQSSWPPRDPSAGVPRREEGAPLASGRWGQGDRTSERILSAVPVGSRVPGSAPARLPGSKVVLTSEHPSFHMEALPCVCRVWAPCWVPASLSWWA